MPARNASGSVVRFDPYSRPMPRTREPRSGLRGLQGGEQQPAARAGVRRSLVDPERREHEAVGEHELERAAEALGRLVVHERAATDDAVEDVDLQPGALGERRRPPGLADPGDVPTAVGGTGRR